MSSNPWGKFFWQDWESDQGLKLCSLAAQGLWMRMLCIAAAHNPVGYVSVAGKPLDETSLARLTGASESEVETLLQELEQHGVFSRDRHGRIYSRRMIRDAKRSAQARKNGKLGGNPSIRKQRGNSGSVNPQVKLQVKGGVKTHKPEARYKPPISPKGEVGVQEKKKEKELPDWMPEESWNGFLEMRRRIKKPLTERARALIINELDRLRASGNPPGEVLDQSVMNCWQGVFQLREANKRTNEAATNADFYDQILQRHRRSAKQV